MKLYLSFYLNLKKCENNKFYLFKLKWTKKCNLTNSFIVIQAFSRISRLNKREKNLNKMHEFDIFSRKFQISKYKL